MENSRHKECIIALSGAILSFITASVILSGFPDGLRPNIAFPYLYAGDALFQYSMIQRSMEGWVTNSQRLGYPFGSPWFDYPSSDALNLLALKVLGNLFGTYYAAANIYFLLGFSFNFLAAFFLLRYLRLKTWIAYASSFLFAFSAYNFAREYYGHTFYTWYFVVPLYTFISLIVYDNKVSGVRKNLYCIAALFICSSFGVYYAFYGFLTIGLAGLVGFVREFQLVYLKRAFVFCSSIVVGTLSNLASHLLYVARNGENELVAQRIPMETEVYSLKLTHLILPPPDHRLQAFSEIGGYYAENFPLSNTVSYLGIFGIFGFVIICCGFLFGRLFDVLQGRLFIIKSLFFFSVITVTTGGLSVLFSLFISPTIRGWDRFSVFILLYSLIAFSAVMSRIGETILRQWVFIGSASVIFLGLLDQTSHPSSYIARSSRSTFEMDREIIRDIEASLPVSSAIYQIPYHPFPEEGPLHQLTVYEQLTPFLNSQTLRWSSGGVKGREASDFYARLNEKSLDEQISTVRSLGFSGVYLHKAGYADGGREVEAELERILGSSPSFSRSDGLTSFFFLTDKAGVDAMQTGVD